jgi:hypothetical protein
MTVNTLSPSETSDLEHAKPIRCSTIATVADGSDNTRGDFTRAFGVPPISTTLDKGEAGRWSSGRCVVAADELDFRNGYRGDVIGFGRCGFTCGGD